MGALSVTYCQTLPSTQIGQRYIIDIWNWNIDRTSRYLYLQCKAKVASSVLYSISLPHHGCSEPNN